MRVNEKSSVDPEKKVVVSFPQSWYVLENVI